MSRGQESGIRDRISTFNLRSRQGDPYAASLPGRPEWRSIVWPSINTANLCGVRRRASILLALQAFRRGPSLSDACQSEAPECPVAYRLTQPGRKVPPWTDWVQTKQPERHRRRFFVLMRGREAPFGSVGQQFPTDLIPVDTFFRISDDPGLQSRTASVRATVRGKWSWHGRHRPGTTCGSCR